MPHTERFDTDQRRGAARAVSAANAWLWALCTVGYMLPWAVAAQRGAANSAQTFWVNLLLGWTVVGWLAALVMALRPHRVTHVAYYHGYGQPAAMRVAERYE